MAELAAQDRFSGVVPLSYPGWTVFVAQLRHGRRRERDPQPRGIAFNLSSTSGPYLAVAVLLASTFGIDAPMPDGQRVFHRREEVHEYYRRWTRQATLVGVPGAGSNGHTAGGGAGIAMAAQIVETVTA